MSSNNKIPFGLKKGVLVSVSEVESGLACDCVCPSCRRSLQANKGERRAHYFSHDPSEDIKDCKTAFETAIHLMAKQILSEEGCSVFPELAVKVTKTDDAGVLHEEVAQVEDMRYRSFATVKLEVKLEVKLDGIRPDIIAYEGSQPILIEVAVTHFSDRDKITTIRDKSLMAIEIDLSGVSYLTTKEELKKEIINEVKNKKWLSNPESVSIKQKLKEKIEEKVRRINETIAQDRKKAFSQQKRYKLPRVRKTYKAPSFEAPLQSDKKYSLRWFACEACRHIFTISTEQAPYGLPTVPCPECGHPVSTETLFNR